MRSLPLGGRAKFEIQGKRDPNGMEVRQEEIVVLKHGVVTEDLLSWG